MIDESINTIYININDTLNELIYIAVANLTSDVIKLHTISRNLIRLVIELASPGITVLGTQLDDMKPLHIACIHKIHAQINYITT